MENERMRVVMETFRNDKLGNKKITISDIAEALQVSKTTVSRAISGKGRIGKDMGADARGRNRYPRLYHDY